jgi:hypothetical protein
MHLVQFFAVMVAIMTDFSRFSSGPPNKYQDSILIRAKQSKIKSNCAGIENKKPMCNNIDINS